MTVAKPDKPCQRCGGERDGTRYCRPCSAIVTRERGTHPERRKPCPECGKPKEPGKRKFCVACREKRQPVVKIAERDRARFKGRRERLARGVMPRVPKVNEAGEVRCSICEMYLPPHEFTKVRQGAGRPAKYAPNCRSCYSNYLHEHRLRTMFDMTIEDYERLQAQQDGRCAICLCVPRTRRLAVDHDHKTDEIRGLLCSRCNHKVLGAANESPSLLRRAARYLDTPPARTGAPLSALGDEEDQGWRAFEEACEKLQPGDVEMHNGIFAVSLLTMEALAQAAGFALVIEGETIPSRELSLDDVLLLDKTWKNSEPLLRVAGFIAEQTPGRPAASLMVGEPREGLAGPVPAARLVEEENPNA